MMWTVFFVLLLCYPTKEDYDARCGNGFETGLTFETSSDDVEGRYIVEWCTTADTNVTSWELTLRYDDRAPERCVKYSVGPPGAIHSRFHQPIKLVISCTNVCFSTTLDLIFNGTCYHIQAWLRRHTTSSSPHDSLHYVINSYDKDRFTQSETMFASESIGEELIIHWYLGHIPAADYTVTLYDKDYIQSVDLTSGCSVTAEATHVTCRGRVPYGCYAAALRHAAPWTAGQGLFAAHVRAASALCHAPAVPLAVPRAPAAAAADLWWAAAAGALALAALAGLAALAAWRARADLHSRKRVLFAWRTRVAGGAAGQPAAGGEGRGAGVVALVCARECGAVARVAGAAAAAVAAATGARVVEVGSSAAVGAAAAGAATWVRELLRREDVRVLILATPAAQYLYTPELDATRTPPTLSAPLMGARVAPRRPHAGAALAALALRTVAETAHHHPHPYRKYYVAQIADLQAEVLPELTPLRRYTLPDAAPALLRDLAPGPPGAPAAGPPAPAAGAPELRELCAAVGALQEYVRANPDYLADELIFL